MSWAEVKKINSNMNMPLDKAIPIMLENIIVGGYVWTCEPGENTLSIPSGLSSVYVSACGAGGSGAGGVGVYYEPSSEYSAYTNTGGAGGGRAQDFILNKKEHVSTNEIVVTVGQGGASVAGINTRATRLPVGGYAGKNGGDTIVFGTTYRGGTGATAAATNNKGTGGNVGGSQSGEPAGTSSNANGGAGGSFSEFGIYGNGGKGGNASYYNNNASEAGKNGFVIITWGGVRYADIWADIQIALNNGQTHGGSE